MVLKDVHQKVGRSHGPRHPCLGDINELHSRHVPILSPTVAANDKAIIHTTTWADYSTQLVRYH